MVACAYHWLTSTFWGGILIGGILSPILLSVVVTMFKWLFSKPKIVFGDPYYKAEDGQVENICWEIPVKNLRRYGLWGYLVQRREAVECHIRIEFIMNGKVLGYAYPWGETIPIPGAKATIGKTLPANSQPDYFPIVAMTSFCRAVYFPNTLLSTDPVSPTLKIPDEADVVANIEVISRGIRMAKSKWLIKVRQGTSNPMEIKRIYEL